MAIWLYSTTEGEWYRRINDPLRLRHTLQACASCVAGHLVAALGKLPRHAGRVFRGITVGNLDEFLARHQPGQAIVWTAFSSSSANPDYAIRGNVLFMIDSNHGRMLGEYADVQEEEEVVFLPRSQFRVIGLERHDARAIISLREISSSMDEPIGDEP